MSPKFMINWNINKKRLHFLWHFCLIKLNNKLPLEALVLLVNGVASPAALPLPVGPHLLGQCSRAIRGSGRCCWRRWWLSFHVRHREQVFINFFCNRRGLKGGSGNLLPSSHITYYARTLYSQSPVGSHVPLFWSMVNTNHWQNFRY